MDFEKNDALVGGFIVLAGMVMVVTSHHAAGSLPLPSETGIGCGPNSTNCSPGRPSLTRTRTVEFGLPRLAKLFIHTW